MSESQAYFFALLTIGSLLYLLREKILNPGPSARGHTASLLRDLTPTEVAFLTKEGDGGFALLILVFDVLHREMKDKVTGGEITIFDENQKSYELALRKAAGGSLKEWSRRKVETVAGISFDDPIRLAKRVPALYKFFRSGVEGSIKDLLRDPRNIKKFISVPGLMRLAADIGATGYRQTMSDLLKEQLTDEGFLATDYTRHHAIKVLLASYGICQIMLLTLILLTIPSQLHAICIYIGAFIAAFVAQTCTGAREFIPLYKDLSRALAEAGVENIRIAIIRAVLNIFTLILNIFSVFVFFILFGVGLAVLYQTHTVTSITTYLMLLAQMSVQLIALTYLFEAYKLSVGEMPTREAKECLAVLKKKYRQEQTLPALKSMLTENSYNQDLSFLIALYGLETLLLI